jgi:hypothetical protein
MNDILNNVEDPNLAPIIDEEAIQDLTSDNISDDSITEEEIAKEDQKEELSTIPDSSKECSFGIDDNDDILEDDIRRMLFLFCVNEDIPIHYKQLLGKVIKKKTYQKNEKLFIFNMIGYVWQKAKQNEDLTKTQKIIIVRRIHKLLFGKFDD